MDTYFEEDQDEIEYNPLDEILEQTTSALLKVAKNNVAATMAALKRENAALKKENTRLMNEWAQAFARERELEIKEAELNRIAAQMPIEKFFGQRAVIMYKPSHERLAQAEKCDKCDENRNIRYLTPLGKTAYETCDCNKYNYGWMPEERVLTELRKDNRRLLMWFKRYEREEDGYTRNDFVEDEDVYTGGAFDGLNKYKAYFRDIEDCQRYCDWLNSVALT